LHAWRGEGGLSRGAGKIVGGESRDRPEKRSGTPVFGLRKREGTSILEVRVKKKIFSCDERDSKERSEKIKWGAGKKPSKGLLTSGA